MTATAWKSALHIPADQVRKKYLGYSSLFLLSIPMWWFTKINLHVVGERTDLWKQARIRTHRYRKCNIISFKSFSLPPMKIHCSSRAPLIELLFTGVILLSSLRSSVSHQFFTVLTLECLWNLPSSLHPHCYDFLCLFLTYLYLYPCKEPPH